MIPEASCKLVTFDSVVESIPAMTARLVEGSAGITAALHAAIKEINSIDELKTLNFIYQ